MGIRCGDVLFDGDVAGKDFYGEFDPGSELTLAACLTHASRAGSGRVSRF